MYQQRRHAGSSPEFWSENWDALRFEDSVRFCAIDPLRPLFEKYLRPDSRILEGGCGMGHYLAWWAAGGHRAIGLDFALRTLATLRARQPHLNVSCGDVAHLPFLDQSFDVYYSGGVVEHFEGGAGAALREARRVLKRDGILLISVPYHSPLRTLIRPLKKKIWRKADTTAAEGLTFFQYAYRRGEFEEMLAAAGLKVIGTQGYAVLWGLADLWLSGAAEPAVQSAPDRCSAAVDATRFLDVPRPSLLKRLVVSEDDRVLIAGAFVRIMRRAAANMMMYVCMRR